MGELLIWCDWLEERGVDVSLMRLLWTPEMRLSPPLVTPHPTKRDGDGDGYGYGDGDGDGDGYGGSTL